MELGQLTDHKLISLILHGYNPFQPDIGIFCGGYQGPLYPNPTTLIYPGFDVLSYAKYNTLGYEMNGSYSGLGIGNPSIDTRNPGHVLGILDTFSRMSYGVGVLMAVFEGSDGTPTTINPVVDVVIPMEQNDTDVEMSDIYPSLSEKPTDWIDSFTVNELGQIDPDPRPMTIFPTPGGHYIPKTHPIDADAFQRLFGGKSIFAYFGMPKYFQSVMGVLSVTADEYMSEKTEHGFYLENPASFNSYSSQTSPGFFHPIPDPDYSERNSEGTCYLQCVVNTPSQALEILTGSTDFHDGKGIMNEFRSLTELNSVINIIPVQMAGATFWEDVKDPWFRDGIPYAWDYGGRSFQVASYMIVDLVLNISDIISNTATVTIDGIATISPLITSVAAESYRSYVIVKAFSPIAGRGDIIITENGATQNSKKNVDISMSETNEFSWDKVWLDESLIRDTNFSEESISLLLSNGGSRTKTTPYGGSPGPWIGEFIDMDQSDFEVPFNKTFTLGAGCTSIRMRAFLRNRHVIGQRATQPPNTWSQPPHPGIIGGGYVGNPDGLPGALSDNHMNLSFTVTGDNMKPMNFELSI